MAFSSPTNKPKTFNYNSTENNIVKFLVNNFPNYQHNVMFGISHNINNYF